MPGNLTARFGSPGYYEDIFNDNSDRTKVKELFNILDSNPARPMGAYEISRQQFLRMLGEHRMVWQVTNGEYDQGVSVSRIYHRNRHEYLAFMRIQPQGFRSERVVPTHVEMKFHVLMGNVIFTNRGRIRIMSKGHHTTVGPKATYSIRCNENDQSAFLIFRMVDKSKRHKE